MFIGHFGLGLGTRRAAALPSLAMLFIAVQFLDLLWPVFVFMGLEQFSIEPGATSLTPLNFQHYPYSHSLLMAFVWGALLSLVYFFFSKNKRGAVTICALVVSHWILDYFTHRPDLPLTPFSTEKYGLGLWNHPVLETSIEMILFLGGAWLYYQSTGPARRWSYALLIFVLLLIHILNIFGPPPPSVNAVAGSAMLMWLFIIWAWWVERPLKNV